MLKFEGGSQSAVLTAHLQMRTGLSLTACELANLRLSAKILFV